MFLVKDALIRAAVEYAVEDLEGLEDMDERLASLAWKIAEEAKQFWGNEAGRFLSSTRTRYQQSLEVYEDFSGGVVVGMNPKDELVVAIEEGAPSYDMKPGFLNGAALRVIPINPPRDMRAVSAGHGAGKWIHPGFRGLNLVKDVDEHIDEVLIPKYLNELFSKL